MMARAVLRTVMCIVLWGCNPSLDVPREADVECATDAECPGRQVCIATLRVCRLPEAECVTQAADGFDVSADGTPCEDSTGVCIAGACGAPTCGDGVVTAPEECDPAEPDIFCRDTCVSIRCGDGVPDNGDICDDGNDVEGDGCDSNCTPSTCGNGITGGAEECDDGNTFTEPCVYGAISCGVCDENCQSVAGATSFCGDGKVDSSAGEECDDGGVLPDDGCSATCQLETSFRCLGEPSLCVLILRVSPSGSLSGNGASWGTAFRFLQDALTVAQAAAQDTPVEVWVAAGSHYPDESSDMGTPIDSDLRSAVFAMGNGVAWYGGFEGTETLREDRDPASHLTLLNGDLTQDDQPLLVNHVENSRTIVTAFGVDTSAILDGFVIRGAYNDGSNGGGLIVTNTSTPLIRNCVFLDNQALNGGAFSSAILGDAVFEDCTFTNNRTLPAGDGGAGYIALSNVTFTRCGFEGNQANFGGAIWVSGGSASVSASEFQSNVAMTGGGAVYGTGTIFTANQSNFVNNSATTIGGALNLSGGFARVTEARFEMNSANVGGVLDLQGTSLAEFWLCDFFDNSAANEGGALATIVGEIRVYSSRFVANSAPAGAVSVSGSNGVVNMNACTAWANAATGGGTGAAAVYVKTGTSVDIGSSIFWGNTPTEIDNQGTIVVGHSIVQGGFTGTSVSAADPMFVDSDGPDNVPGTVDDDLRLSSGSPAIDAGVNQDIPDGVTTVDLALNPRFVDDPATPDTGFGSAPLLDRGAYEFQP